MRNTFRFILTAILMLATGLLLQARGRKEVFPSRLPLKAFPTQLGPWNSEDIAIDKDVLEVLGPGDFLLRVYENQAITEPYANLFIAYFPSQRAGDTIHSPKNCLPGAGWTPVESTRVSIEIAGHVPFPANRYVIAKGDSRQLVLYWYWAHDRGVASEYWAKIYLVTDSMRMHRSDGALVRLTTVMQPGETADVAQQRLMPLVLDIVPRLEGYIPR
jgi:EpsI family protein